MTFKYLVIVALGAFVAYLLAVPRTATLRKGSVLAFVAAMLLFAIKPEWSTALARLLGIGRGVDLLFYLSHMVLFFIAFMYYLKFKEMERRFTKLVRHIALETGRGEAVVRRAT